MRAEAAGIPAYYLNNARNALQQRFRIVQRVDREAVVEFTVSRDGTISNPRIIRSSGSPQLDEAALNAVRETRRLGPLPEGFQGESTVMRVTFDFSGG